MNENNSSDFAAAWFTLVEPEEATPISLILDLTHACDYKCSDCIEKAGRALSRHSSLSSGVAVRVLDWFASQGGRQVGFYGGEPLLHRHFSEIVTHASELAFSKIHLVTNGSQLYDATSIAAEGSYQQSFEA